MEGKFHTKKIVKNKRRKSDVNNSLNEKLNLFLVKNEDIYDKDQKKIEKIQKKINYLQELLSNNFKTIDSFKKNKSLKGNKKNFIKIPKNKISTNNALRDSLHIRYKSDEDKYVNGSLNFNEDYFVNTKKVRKKVEKKPKIFEIFIKDKREITYRDNIQNLRNNGNYSIDKEN